MKTTILVLLIIITSNGLLAQTTAVPDTNFEKSLISLGYDSGLPDGFVLTANIDTIELLVVRRKEIKSLVGIEDFKSLKVLECSRNKIDSLDITKNTKLTTLFCDGNSLTELNTTKNIALTRLKCEWNTGIKNLDVSKNTA